MSFGVTTRARHVLLALAAIVIAATAPFAEAAAPSGPSDPSIWAWVVARQPAVPAYIPGPKDRGNSSGYANIVHRTGTGRYDVQFGKISPGNCDTYGWSGTFLLTALSPSQRTCSIVDRIVEAIPGQDVFLELRCFDRNGALADTMFAASYVVVRDHTGDVAHLFAHSSDNTEFYEPQKQHNFTEAVDQGNWVGRTGTGRYRVWLQFEDAFAGGNMQVLSGYGPCKLTAREGSIQNDSFVTVICRDFAGQRLDTQFWLTFTEGVGITADHTGQRRAAYLFANKPTTGSYVPAGAFRFSSEGRSARVIRTGVGRYTARLFGMSEGGVAHVTSFGSGTAACQLTSIRKSGLPQEVGVRCFKANGDPVDSQFYLTYTR